MEALMMNSYAVDSNKQVVPSWMRDERYMYCEPVERRESIWKKITHLFA